MAELNKILHVEDDIDIQAVALLALETLGGFTVAQVSSGRDALEMAPTFLPDLVLLDVMMPGMNGEELLIELRKRESTARTPVIFMTAKAQSQEVQRFKDLGAVDVITKPFDPVALAGIVRTIWNRIG